MVLSDKFDCKTVLKHVDIWIFSDGPYQALLDFKTGIVGMMQDAEFRVSALAVQIKLSVGIPVKINTPLKQSPDLSGCTFYDFFNSLTITKPVTCDHSIVNVFVEIVDKKVGHRGYAALGKSGICFLKCRFA